MIWGGGALNHGKKTPLRLVSPTCVLETVDKMAVLECPITVKTHNDHGNSYKGKHSLGLVYIFRDLVHSCHGETHDSRQAAIVLEKTLRVLHPDQQAAERESPGLAWAFETPKAYPKEHTFSNKAASISWSFSSSATP